MVGIETTPTVKHIFEVIDSTQLLDKDRKKYFHTITARQIFLSKISRPNLQEAVSFLTTIMKGPDMYNYKKYWLGHQIPKEGSVNSPYHIFLQHTYSEVVGWCVICCSPIHEKSHRSHNVSWQGLNILHISETEAQHEELYRI